MPTPRGMTALHDGPPKHGPLPKTTREPEKPSIGPRGVQKLPLQCEQKPLGTREPNRPNPNPRGQRPTQKTSLAKPRKKRQKQGIPPNYLGTITLRAPLLEEVRVETIGICQGHAQLRAATDLTGGLCTPV